MTYSLFGFIIFSTWQHCCLEGCSSFFIRQLKFHIVLLCSIRRNRVVTFACRKKNSFGTAAKGHAVALQTLALSPATCCKVLWTSSPAAIPTHSVSTSTPAHTCCSVVEQTMSWGYSAHCSRSADHFPKAHPAFLCTASPWLPAVLCYYKSI